MIVPVAVFSIPALMHLTSGEPLIFSDFRGNIPTHAAGKGELIAMLLMPLELSALGVFTIFSWNKKCVQTDEAGIRRLGPNGQLRFTATWPEIKSVAKETTQAGKTNFIVRSDTGRMDFPGSTTHLKELLQFIRSKAPHDDFTPWD